MFRSASYSIASLLVIYSWLIVARAFLSWFSVRPGGPFYPVVRVIHFLTEPYLRLFRRFVPVARFGNVGFDLSMLVALVFLWIVIQVLWYV